MVSECHGEKTRAAGIQPGCSKPTLARCGMIRNCLPPPRNRTSPFLRNSRTCSKRRGSACRLASRRSARRFATRSRRAISPSVRASSSRWSWNFSSSRDEVVEAIAGRVATAAGKFRSRNPNSVLPASRWQIHLQLVPPARCRRHVPIGGWEAVAQILGRGTDQVYEGIGLPRTTLEEYWQKPEELAHYARACVDILFKFPFGTAGTRRDCRAQRF